MRKYENKSGRWTPREIEFLHDNIALSDEEIAKILKRNIKSVRSHRLKLDEYTYTKSLEKPLAILHELYFWDSITKQLLDHEVRYFEQQWIRYWDQFSHSDILPTDEVMMKDVIMLDIMCNRASERKTSQIRRSSELMDEITAIYQQPIEERNTVRLANLETQYGACQAASVDANKEYLDHQDKKDKKMTQLKATRDQRLKQAEQSGKNFWDLCRLLQEKQQRIKDSISMERMKIASDRILTEWSGNSIRFADDEFDKIVLIPEEEVKSDE